MTDFAPGQPVTFTLGEAAKAAGVSKPTLSKAIKAGRLSYEKNEDGSYRIQAGELFRAYPPGRQGNGEDTPEVDEVETGVSEPATRGLAAREADRLRQQLADVNAERERERRQLEDQIADLRRRLDVEGEERRKLTAILTDQRSRPAEPQPAPTPPPARGFFGLFGRRG